MFYIYAKMSDGVIFLISLLCAWALMGIWWFFRRFFIVTRTKKHRYSQSQKIRFLQVRVPKNAVARSSDIEASDHVSTMKDNIALMNQVYKNFYAISDTDLLKRKLGDNYISMELVVENEIIKFFVWVPEDHLLTVQKMIASFYPWALVEIVSQPKLLEAWKYMAGGEFTLTKEAVYPIKTYESFEADPMDSLLSAFSQVWKQEKVCFQILAEPLPEKWLKDMRKQWEKIKKNDKLTVYLPLDNTFIYDDKNNSLYGREVVYPNSAFCKLSTLKDGKRQIAIARGETLVYDSLAYDVPDGEYEFLLKQDKLEVVFDKKTAKGIEGDVLTAAPKGEFLTVSCYDEEPQSDVNYVYAQIKGFDEYVTLAVKNNFSVYKMPKFKILVPVDGFELKPLQ